MTGTTIQTVTQEQFAARTAAQIPRGWASEDAKQGGVMNALLSSTGSQLAFLITAIQYALNSQRLGTAAAPELDMASVEYFGEGVLPRPPGTNNETFAALITSRLFLPAAIRDAIVMAITNLTGVEPRVIEPWNPADTGCWDTGQSFWDVDTRANPARWTDPSLRYQGFIETILPASKPLGSNPLLTMDDGAYWDVPGVYMDPIVGVNAQGVYSTLNSIKAEGTICWVKFVANPQ